MAAAPEDLLRRAARLLAVPLARLAPGEAAPADVAVSRAGGEYRLQSRFETCATPSRNDALMKLVALLSFHFLEASPQTILHAGAFVCGDHAVLFCGPPMAGKSSLAFAAWRRGYAVLGDDWIVVEADDRASAFPKPLKTRLASLAIPAEIAGSLPVRDHLLARLGDEVRLALGRELPGMLSSEARVPVAAMFLLERGPRGATVCAPAPRDEALLALLTQTMQTRGRRLGGVRLLEKLRGAGRVYRLTVGDGDGDGALETMAALAATDRRAG